MGDKFNILFDLKVFKKKTFPDACKNNFHCCNSWRKWEITKNALVIAGLRIKNEIKTLGLRGFLNEFVF